MKVKSELWDVFATGKRLVEKKIKTFTDFEKGPEMVMVPVGSFMMGSPEDEEYRDDWEGPQHKVSITTPFAISKFAITYDEWDFSYQLGGVTHKPYSETPKARGQLPVTRVSWEQVQKMAEQLGLKWENRKMLSAMQIYKLKGINEKDYSIMTFAKQVKRDA